MALHPDAVSFLAILAAQGGPSWEEIPPAEGRAIFASLTGLFGPGPDLASVEDHTTDQGLRLRLYRPSSEPEPQTPLVIFLHGGGWVLGDLSTHDTFCRRLAAGSGACLLAVDYRRPPENPYPAAIEDAWAALQFATAHAESWGIDPSRIAVSGDSAGGNLAAALALRARDEQGPALHSQWLFYPVLDPNFETSSYREFAQGHALERDTMRWFWDQYAPPGVNRDQAYLAPARATSLAGLPPTYLVSAGYDVLRDEGADFVTRLRSAGVPVTVQSHPDMLHGFLHFSEPFTTAGPAIEKLTTAMRTALHQ